MLRFGHNKLQHSIGETNSARLWISNTTECFDLEVTNPSIPLGKPILQNSGCQTRLNASIWTQPTEGFRWGGQFCKTLDVKHDEKFRVGHNKHRSGWMSNTIECFDLDTPNLSIRHVRLQDHQGINLEQQKKHSTPSTTHPPIAIGSFPDSLSKPDFQIYLPPSTSTGAPPSHSVGKLCVARNVVCASSSI